MAHGRALTEERIETEIASQAERLERRLHCASRGRRPCCCRFSAAWLSPLLVALSVHSAWAFECPQPLELVNSSFEMPTLPGPTDPLPPGWIRFHAHIYGVPQDEVPGWQTTDTTNFIELWRNGNPLFPAHDGQHFAELNAFQNAKLFQDADTSGLQGQTLTWSFAHRGRLGVDTMALEIGAPGAEVEIARESTGNTAWAVYSGTYGVPVGQTLTRFGYRAISTAGGNPGAGNFLDAISFGTPPCATDLAIQKSVTPNPYVPGEPVTYTLEITNTGVLQGQYDVLGATLEEEVPAEITNVTWTCEESSGSACGNAGGSGNSINETYDILEGGTVTYTITGTAPEKALPGPLTNTATVDLPPTSGGQPISDTNASNNSDMAVLDAPAQSPGITIEKSGSGPDPLTVGATIDYGFLVTNTGNVTLTGVTVTDPLPDLSPIDCPTTTLAPGADMNCTATYTVTQADVDAGVIENTATVTGQPPQGPPVTDEDSAQFPPQQTPGINVEKSGSGPDPLTVGATVDYSFVVTNTGNVTLSSIMVTDPLPGLSPISCPDSALAPGEDMTCTATYTVTQDDAEAGIIENTATVTGNPPTGPPVTDEDGAVVPPSQKPGISLEKSGGGPDPLTVGATIDYAFLVTNIGNVTLSNVTVTDPLPGLSPISCPNNTLAPGAEMTCTATYTVTQQDVDAGTIENTATVTGRPPGALPPVQDEDSTAFPPDQDVGISIEKSGSGPDPLTVGATVDYTFLVTNTGNVTLSNITITDRLPGLSPISCPGTTLAPGAQMTCAATYTVTQANVDAGVIVNTATVTGHPPTGGPPATSEDTTTVPPVPTVPALPPLAVLLLVVLLSALAMALLRRVRA